MKTARRLARMLTPLALIAPLHAADASSALAQNPAASATLLQRLADEAELSRIPTEIEIAVDRKDWPKARSYFADMIRVDFTSLVGGQPAVIPADGLIAGWSANLKGDKESLHIRGGALVSIEGDRAVVSSNGYAWNRKPGAPDGSGDLWEVWGHYRHEMARTAAGWKVTSFTFTKTHERGSNWVKTTPGS
jgi:hypothetical protein